MRSRLTGLLAAGLSGLVLFGSAIAPAAAKPHGGEGPGSYSHSGDRQFCTTHHCIANFPDGSGYVVQCRDGEWSHSGGRSGACSYHGGERS